MKKGNSRYLSFVMMIIYGNGRYKICYLFFLKKRGVRGKVEVFYLIWGCFGCLLLLNYKFKG